MAKVAVSKIFCWRADNKAGEKEEYLWNEKADIWMKRQRNLRKGGKIGFSFGCHIQVLPWYWSFFSPFSALVADKGRYLGHSVHHDNVLNWKPVLDNMARFTFYLQVVTLSSWLSSPGVRLPRLRHSPPQQQRRRFPQSRKRHLSPDSSSS